MMILSRSAWETLQRDIAMLVFSGVPTMPLEANGLRKIEHNSFIIYDDDDADVRSAWRHLRYGRKGSWGRGSSGSGVGAGMLPASCVLCRGEGAAGFLQSGKLELSSDSAACMAWNFPYYSSANGGFQKR